ncbi:hypothetical protein F0267_00560 [Vibrio coralliilyticus]|uniref:Uncharacterized protein n=2 Tax=Vibrio TaxID=662 RepID=A0AAN0SHW5_9VIBR|nr:MULTISPECIES: hypothetical protein [Vibrio]AIW22615.1 hypothetical protein IX92_26495 [Vibrio coralliilyticus]NOH36711.1 hypothetical protein [Vibrio coralliilyticus]POB46946.1 hypothetical protein CRN52_12780 [Vibrio vulnificus]
MDEPNPYAEAIDPDTVEIRIQGQCFQLNRVEAGIYAAHIANAERNCRMMIDKGYVPEAICVNSPPKDPLKLARDWEKLVLKERDGEGKRFWVGALYLLANEKEKALIYCNDFIERCKKNDQSFSEPAFLLSYLLAVFDPYKGIESGSLVESILFNLYISNPYIIDIVLAHDVEPLDGRVHFTNVTSFGWADSFPMWFTELVTDTQQHELREYVKCTTYNSFVQTHNTLNKACVNDRDKALKELMAFEKRYKI